MHPDWARGLRDQCAAAGVAYLFKQWGAYGPLPRANTDSGVTVANDGTVYQPGDLSYPDGPRYGEAIRAGHDKAHLHAMYRVGKKAAGRELDGRTWDEYPS
jgi:protein gp37